MNRQIAVDREGRQWAVLAVDNTLRGRLISGNASPAVMDLAELVDMYGPLIMSPTRPTNASNLAAFVDTVDLVASDPETASLEQIDEVAAFAQSIVLATRSTARLTQSTPRAAHMRASTIGRGARDEMWGAGVGQNDRRDGCD
ncbi:hypothetical protein ABIC28_005131 [Rhodococcus sp. PvR044]|uniref:hypothetical protein n=1 Tax=Rhodococcus sp. PvR044 TaxID=3156402 RepID=UPI003396D426